MRINPAAVVGLFVLSAVASSAQPAPEPRGYVAIKGGPNIERAEDDLQGTTAGGGAVGGLAFAEAWAIEGEFWLPGAVSTNPEDGRHRDTLFSIAVRRSLGAGRLRPHFLVGASIARTEDEFTTCIANRPTPVSPTPQQMLVSCSDPDVVERHQERFVGTSLFPLLGLGVEIVLTDRVRLIPDVRVQLWVTSVIVRPAIALGMTF